MKNTNLLKSFVYLPGEGNILNFIKHIVHYGYEEKTTTDMLTIPENWNKDNYSMIDEARQNNYEYHEVTFGYFTPRKLKLPENSG